MSSSLLAQRYAAALVGAAGSPEALAAVGRDLQSLGRALAASPELVQALGSPTVPAAAKARLLLALLAEPPQRVTEAFIHLVAERGRAPHVAAIAAACTAAIGHRTGVRVAEVRTAAALSPAQAEALQARLASWAGATVHLHVQLDPALKGGLTVRLGDTVFDGTVGTYLEALRRRLCGSPAPSAST
ncbi:MAG: ATP synthase F1 subunit delta [Gemmatimonadota bacterium]